MATTTAQALQASKNAQLRAQDLAWQEAQRLANEQKGTATAQAESLAQEAFVAKKQQERVLPNVMAQAGLAGQGYTETSANNIGTSYQNAWNSVMKQKGTALDAISSGLAGESSKINQNKANIDAQYQTDLANYQASLRRSGTAPKLTPEQKIDEATAKKDAYKKQASDALKKMPFALTANGNVDPQASRVAMASQLSSFVKYKYLTESEVTDLINGYLEKYYGRTSGDNRTSMTDGQRLTKSLT